MEIANIVCQTKMDLGKEFVIVKSMDEIINHDLPTLVIGYTMVKELFGPELDLMDRKSDGIHWTFAKNEMRDYYNQDLDNFIQYAYFKSVDGLDYLYVDPISMKYGSIRKIVKKIHSIENIVSFLFNDRILYVYGDNLVFGIDLKIIKFIGLDRDKLQNKIENISKVFLEGEEILIEYKNYMERLDQQAKYIPFLYSISNNE